MIDSSRPNRLVRSLNGLARVPAFARGSVRNWVLRRALPFTDAQRSLMQTQNKGEITVAVQVSDESGAHPIECEFIWAWIPSGPRQKLKESP